MDLQLEGKTALVTGASSQGIGRAIALGLAAEGATVAIAARRVELLRKTAREFVTAGYPEPIVLEADLYAEETPHALAAAATDALSRVDILINCAGGSRPLPLDAPAEKWSESLMLNFFRVRELTHALLPGMIKNQWGRIVNITGSSEPYNFNAAAPAKAAVHAWSKCLSREVGRHGVTSNCIQPGRIMSEQILKIYPTEERRQQAALDVPIRRLGQPNELADLAVFLSSPRAVYITGTVIPVDGGLKRFAF